VSAGRIYHRESFTADGEPKKAPSPHAAESRSAASPELEAVKAELAALRAEKQQAEAAKARRTEIAEATAPLAEALKAIQGALKSAPVEKQESEIDRFARLKKAFADEAPKGPSAELAALTKQVTDLSKTIAFQRREAEKAEQARLLAERDTKIDALGKQIADLAAARSAPRRADPLDTFSSEMLKLAKLDRILGSAKRGEEGSSPLLEAFMAKMEKRLSPLLLGLVEDKVAGALEGSVAAAAIGGSAPSSPGANTPPAPESASKFAVFLQGQFQSGFALVNDAAEVAKLRAQFPRHVAELAAITERDPFCAFLVKVGFANEMVQAAVTPETWVPLRAILEKLRLQLAAQPAPPPPAPAPAPAPAPPPGSALGGAAAAVVEPDDSYADDEGDSEFVDELDEDEQDDEGDEVLDDDQDDDDAEGDLEEDEPSA
jgi:hypothetical protein